MPTTAFAIDRAPASLANAGSIARASTPQGGVESAPLDARSAFDAARLDAAREELRRLFAEVSATLPLRAATAQARLTTDEVDAAQRGCELATWPVVRIAAALAGDADAAVARTALRYLGVRGDRLAVRALEDHARGGELAPEAVLALLDLGEASCKSIARLLRSAELGEFARLELERWPAERAVRGLDQSVRRGSANDELPTAMTGRGAPAVPVLVGLERDGLVEREHALTLLARTPEASQTFAAILGGIERIDDSFALAACARLELRAVLPWLANRCREPKSRTAALGSLRAYTDPAALETALELPLSVG